MTGPLMVVGRETSLASGAVDLVAMARGGELVLVEFKTGPQNPDFRHSLAQLLDYGSDLWGMTFEDFERTVAVRYFRGPHCPAEALSKGCDSLETAARRVWPDATDEEWALVADQLRRGLSDGGFHYVVVAQRFAPTMERTVEYLNALAPTAAFYLVELVRFAGAGVSAFEARTILKRQRTTKRATGPTVNEAAFLESIVDDAYRAALTNLLETCRTLDLRLAWGTRGVSIRVLTSDRSEPVSIAWLFPGGGVGWMALSHLTLGYDPGPISDAARLSALLDTYVSSVAELPGAQIVGKGGLKAVMFEPEDVVRSYHAIVEAIATVVGAVGDQE